jgi:hypothetical protein
MKKLVILGFVLVVGLAAGNDLFAQQTKTYRARLKEFSITDGSIEGDVRENYQPLIKVVSSFGSTDGSLTFILTRTDGKEEKLVLTLTKKGEAFEGVLLTVQVGGKSFIGKGGAYSAGVASDDLYIDDLSWILSLKPSSGRWSRYMKPGFFFIRFDCDSLLEIQP